MLKWSLRRTCRPASSQAATAASQTAGRHGTVDRQRTNFFSPTPLCRAALQNELFVSRRGFASRRTGGAGRRAGLSGPGHYRPQHPGRRGAGARRRQAVGLQLLIGAEITPDDAPPVVLLATDRAAYGRLSRLITVGRRRAAKGECQSRSPTWPRMPRAAGRRRRRADRAGRSRRDCCALSRSFRRSLLSAGRIVSAGRRPRGAWTHWPQPAGKPRCRWWPPATFTITLPIAQRLPTCWRPSAPATRWPRRATAVSQCRAASAIARRNGRSCSPLPGGAGAHASKSPSAAPFRSTSCVTNIPRSWPRRATRRWPICAGSPGAEPAGVIRPAFPTRSAGSSSTSWN